MAEGPAILTIKEEGSEQGSPPQEPSFWERGEKMDQEMQNTAIQLAVLAGALAMTAVMLLAPDTTAARVAFVVRKELCVLADEAV